MHYVDRMPVVAADLLVVRAEDAIGSPERYDDVAGLRAVVVAPRDAALGRGQGAEGERGGVLRGVLPVPPPVLEQQQDQHDDDDEEDDAARRDADHDGHLRAHGAGRLAARVHVALLRRQVWLLQHVVGVFIGVLAVGVLGRVWYSGGVVFG